MIKTRDITSKAGILVWIGLLLTIANLWLPSLLTQLGSWPVVMGVIGLLIGLQSKFRHPLGIALILIGGIVYYKTEIPLYTVWYLLPMVLIIGGILTHFVTKADCTASKSNVVLKHTKNDE